MLKILQVGPVPPSVGGMSSGGVATNVWDLARHLKALGQDIAILADNYQGTEKKVDDIIIYGLGCGNPQPDGVKMILSTYKGLIGKEFIAENLPAYYHAINNFRPDIIYVHHLENRYPLAYFASEETIPIVAAVHSLHSVKHTSYLKRARYKKLIKKNLEHVEYLILDSSQIKTELEGLFGKIGGKFWIGNDGVDCQLFCTGNKIQARENLGLGKGKLVLFVGNLQERKGPMVLLKTLPIVGKAYPDIQYLFVGNGEEMKKLEAEIKRNSFDDSAKLCGPVENIHDYYCASDVFVLPSKEESFGLVYLEAMACGVPVIGTTGVPEEIIPNNEVGYRVSPGDEKALAASIEKALAENWDTEKIINHAQSFSWDKKTKDIERIFKEIVGEV